MPLILIFILIIHVIVSAIKWLEIHFILVAVVCSVIAGLFIKHRITVRRHLYEQRIRELRQAEESERLYRERIQEYQRIISDSGIEIINGWTKEEKGLKFENVMALYFEKIGAKVQRTRTTGDFGADLVVTNPKTQKTIAVQCKCYNPNRKVSVHAVSEVTAAVAHYKAHRGMVITNVLFTKSAIELARTNKIILWDKNELIKRLADAQSRRFISDIQSDDSKVSRTPMFTLDSPNET